MGLRMDNQDIHAPTVTSGPTGSVSTAQNGSSDSRTLTQLIDDKTKMEAELSALGGVLDSHGVTMATPLTTFDGFPRPDLDVAQIRTTRTRIIRLLNDHKVLMQKIETGLHETHAQHQANLRQHTTPSSQSSTSATQNARSQTHSLANTPGLVETPFALINSVAPRSPAAEAGLEAGDRLRRIGDVTWLNHEKLAKVAELVSRQQGRSVVVKVVRGEEELELRLVPRAGWGGRGLLGCHLLPL